MRTFKHPGIDVITKGGLVTLTRELAQQLKEQMDEHDEIKFIDGRVQEASRSNVCRPYSCPKNDVCELAKWEARMGLSQEDSD